MNNELETDLENVAVILYNVSEMWKYIHGEVIHLR